MISVILRLAAFAAFFAAAFGTGWWVNGNRWEVKYNKLSAEYAQFVATTKAAGEQARKLTEAKDAENQRAKRAADEENRRTRVALNIALNSLRHARPARSFVPDTPAASKRADLICFDRAEYIAADGRFTEGARGLADEGTAAAVDLDSARLWARDRE